MSEETVNDENQDAHLEGDGRLSGFEHVLAFAIGAALGVGLAAVWLPERRRAPAGRLGRVRRASSAALDELRAAAREVAADFREELGATLEAGREQIVDMTHKQLDQARRAMRRETRSER